MAYAMSQLMKKIFSLAFLCVAMHANASPMFDDNAVIDVELTGPIGSLIKKKTIVPRCLLFSKRMALNSRYRFAFAARAACASANFHR